MDNLVSEKSKTVDVIKQYIAVCDKESESILNCNIISYDDKFDVFTIVSHMHIECDDISVKSSNKKLEQKLDTIIKLSNKFSRKLKKIHNKYFNDVAKIDTKTAINPYNLLDCELKSTKATIDDIKNEGLCVHFSELTDTHNKKREYIVKKLNENLRQNTKEVDNISYLSVTLLVAFCCDIALDSDDNIMFRLNENWYKYDDNKDIHKAIFRRIMLNINPFLTDADIANVMSDIKLYVRHI